MENSVFAGKSKSNIAKLNSKKAVIFINNNVSQIKESLKALFMLNTNNTVLNGNIYLSTES